jgi:hypothetical protein
MSDVEKCFICRKHKGLEIILGGPIYEDELVFSGHSWSAENELSPYLVALSLSPNVMFHPGLT